MGNPPAEVTQIRDLRGEVVTAAAGIGSAGGAALVNTNASTTAIHDHIVRSGRDFLDRPLGHCRYGKTQQRRHARLSKLLTHPEPLTQNRRRQLCHPTVVDGIAPAKNVPGLIQALVGLKISRKAPPAS